MGGVLSAQNDGLVGVLHNLTRFVRLYVTINAVEGVEGGGAVLVPRVFERNLLLAVELRSTSYM